MFFTIFSFTNYCTYCGSELDSANFCPRCRSEKMSIEDFDDIPEDDVDDVFRDVLNLIMEKLEEGTNYWLSWCYDGTSYDDVQDTFN